MNAGTERTTGGLYPSPFKFQRHGRSGLEISELLPQLANIADDLCIVRSMYTFNPTHTPARSLFHSGNIAATRPSMGAWISYGLGSENQNLPGFVVLGPGGGGGPGARSGFLPALHQGVSIDDSVTDPQKMIRFLRNDKLDLTAQRRQLDFVQQANRAPQVGIGVVQLREMAHRRRDSIAVLAQDLGLNPLMQCA